MERHAVAADIVRFALTGPAIGLPMLLGSTPALADAPPPAAPTLSFAFEEVVELASEIRPGRTSLGGRNIVPITGGRFKGPGLKGTVLPGGWDWQLERSDSCLQIKAEYFLKTDDGVVIAISNTGVACKPEEGKPLAVRTHPVFEAPVGKYDWLNRATFIGTLVPDNGKVPAVRIRFYQVN